MIILASNNCLCHWNLFQTDVNTMSKTSKFCKFRTIRFCSNCSSIWLQYLLNNVWKDFRLLLSASVITTWKTIFAVNLPFKLFRATVANTNTESLKSLYTLFDTYLDYMLAKFEPNRIVQDIQKLNFWTKNRVFKNYS